MGNQINQEIIKYYNENKGLLYRFTKNFKFLGQDELYSAKLIGIWKALQKKKESNLSLNTLVGKQVKWECWKLVYEKKSKFTIETFPINNLVEKSIENDSSLDFLEEIDFKFLQDRYLNRYTVREMSEKYNLSNNSITKKIEEIKQYIIDKLNFCEKSV